jgi:hypothetical protein
MALDSYIDVPSTIDGREYLLLLAGLQEAFHSLYESKPKLYPLLLKFVEIGRQHYKLPIEMDTRFSKKRAVEGVDIQLYGVGLSVYRVLNDQLKSKGDNNQL